MPSPENTAGLIQHITSVLAAQDNIHAAWLGGSYGRGDQDIHSDIDFVACVENDVHTHASALFNALCKACDTLFNKTIIMPDQAVLNIITRAWERIDLTVIPVKDVPQYSRNSVKILFDYKDITASMPADTDHIPFPVTQLTRLTEEFIRVLGLMPVVIARNNLVSESLGISIKKGMLADLMKLEKHHHDGPQPHFGALALKKSLSPDNYTLLENLPPIPAHDRDALIAYNGTLAHLFFPKAYALYQTYGLEWPDEFYRVTMERLQKLHNITTPTL